MLNVQAGTLPISQRRSVLNATPHARLVFQQLSVRLASMWEGWDRHGTIYTNKSVCKLARHYLSQSGPIVCPVQASVLTVKILLQIE